MRSYESFKQILLCRLPIDGRKQINGLSNIVVEQFAKDSQLGGLFVFVNKGRDTLKMLYWDRTGFALWIKRLERDRFRWPTSLEDQLIELDQKELGWLLDGIDIAKTRPHKSVSYSAY